MIKLDEFIKKQIRTIKKLNESQYKDIEQAIKNITNDYKKITRNIDKYFDNLHKKVGECLSHTEYKKPAREWQRRIRKDKDDWNNYMIDFFNGDMY